MSCSFNFWCDFLAKWTCYESEKASKTQIKPINR